MQYLNKSFSVFGESKLTKCERCVNYKKQSICNNCRCWNKFCEPQNTKRTILKRKIDELLITLFIKG